MKWNIIKCRCLAWLAGLAGLVRIGWVNLRSWVAVGRARNLARNSSAIADRRSSESESGSWLSLKLIAYQLECILSTGFGPVGQHFLAVPFPHFVSAYLRLCGIFKWRFFALGPNSMRASIFHGREQEQGQGQGQGLGQRSRLGDCYSLAERSLIFNYFARYDPTMFAIVEGSCWPCLSNSELAWLLLPFVTSILKHLITISLRTQGMRADWLTDRQWDRDTHT